MAVLVKNTFMKQKPQLSFWQIWSMSFGFLGIQFGWGLQMANMTPIYRYLGAEPDKIPMLWLAAPMTGLLVQPVIGYLSDRTWNGLGRRKPYFLMGAILASLALLFMPNSSTLWMAAGLLWIMDASINITMEPFRAFVADMSPENQQTQGFTMQSFFIGIGSVLASYMPLFLTKVLGIQDDPTAAIPTTVKYAFYFGAVAFIGAVLWTITKTKEYPPEDMAAFEKEKAESKGLFVFLKEMFSEIFNNIFNMPKTMRQLALVQFFTWPGLFLMWFYFGDAVATYVFKAPNPDSPLYKEGAAWAGGLFGWYSVITFLFAFILKEIADRLGKKLTHTICLSIGAIGLLSVSFLTDKWSLYFSMSCVGIAWASILSMPYAMLAPSLPPQKMGIYMGIFNFFIVIPEIIATLCFGPIMKHVLNNNSLHAVMIGGGLLLLAAVLTLLVKETSAEGEGEG